MLRMRAKITPFRDQARTLGDVMRHLQREGSGSVSTTKETGKSSPEATAELYRSAAHYSQWTVISTCVLRLSPVDSEGSGVMSTWDILEVVAFIILVCAQMVTGLPNNTDRDATGTVSQGRLMLYFLQLSAPGPNHCPKPYVHLPTPANARKQVIIPYFRPELAGRPRARILDISLGTVISRRGFSGFAKLWGISLANKADPEELNWSILRKGQPQDSAR